MGQKDYKELIQEKLSKKRYQHSLAVAEKAVELAKEYGVDTEKAYLAGILHDIMKDTHPDEQMKMMLGYKIMLSDVERCAQKLWHAILGAAYAERELKIEDHDVLNAIRYHTTGRSNMSKLEKVLFVADFISEDRDYDGVEKLREAAAHGLLALMLAGTTFTILDLGKRSLPIHPDTVAAYNQVVLEVSQFK